ncbi:hypothetical protein [Flammeovirga kamogawensis]|uniref:HEAT repeat domain-containing protein n=1 Tax=Flammeovirga kamogawensis TaxID=373891 RepID=A0ABX8H1W0_9BACT|nr:hypothetical protein [Flammeovirga kamogawensis]MBB6462557.1 hypothetical protein [Flammeovirga kamogawensis]QWG09693.1 hypothetical protein KM029_24120 [Flammeovirga kamogawensis]TRX65205.1 hypothetical protein EO216_22015 [Flammeovirga kamogawensis]
MEVIRNIEDRDNLIQKILKEQKQVWLYNEIRSNDNVYGNKLAWVLTALCEIDNLWLSKYTSEIIEWLPVFKTQGIKRSMLRSIASLPLLNEKESEWIDYCFSLLVSQNTDVAVKVFALEILGSFCERYPELIGELRIAIEDGRPFYTAALNARVKKVFGRLSTKGIY